MLVELNIIQVSTISYVCQSQMNIDFGYIIPVPYRNLIGPSLTGNPEWQKYLALSVLMGKSTIIVWS